MNTKIIAIIVIVILAVAAVGAGLFILNNSKDNELNVLAGVNNEGSGLYIDKGIDVSTMFDSDWNPIPSGWEGKVFGTPGTATIQHVQIIQIAESMGMKYTLYDGDTSAPNTIYLYPNISNASLAIGNNIIDGGSLWQPQYQKIVDDSSSRFKELALTNDLFPGHACCVIAGYHGYTSSHEDETARFLAAYVEAVEWVNTALHDGPGCDDYDTLISIAKNKVGPNFTEKEIIESLATVTFYYGNNSSTPLSGLKGEIASLSEDLVSLGQTQGKTLSDSGFSNSGEFVERFVDDSFLSKALQLLADPNAKSNISDTTSINVSVIAGDIHQIAIHIADELGFFEEWGIHVTFIPRTNGPEVATAIQNGDASFGLLGAPPLTIRVISGELLKA